MSFEKLYRVKDYAVFLFDIIWNDFITPLFRIFSHIKSLLLLLLTLLMSALFLLTKNGDYLTLRKIYPFSDVEVTRDTYVYFLFEHLILVIFALDRLFISIKFRTALIIFVGIQIIDTFDYLLFYGETWFFIESYPVSWNILKVTIFTLAIINEVILHLEERNKLL